MDVRSFASHNQPFKYGIRVSQLSNNLFFHFFEMQIFCFLQQQKFKYHKNENIAAETRRDYIRNVLNRLEPFYVLYNVYMHVGIK